MPVESASFISQLNPASPAAGDLKSEGDDQLRVIKAAVLGSFPSLGASAVTATAADLSKVGVTQPATSNDTSPASTAFVQGALASAFASGTVAAVWVSGTTYSAGAVVYSPINFATYRRKIAGAGTTDPSLDSTNWAILAASASGGGSQTTSAANITLTSSSNRVQSINMTAAGLNVTLPDATTLQTGGPTFILSATAASNPYVVNDSAGNFLGRVPAGVACIIALVANATAAGVWQFEQMPVQSVLSGTTPVVGTAVSANHLSVAAISDTQAIVTWLEAGVSKAVVVTYASGTVAFGVVFNTSLGAGYINPSSCAITSTQAVLLFQEGTNTKAAVLTASGTGASATVSMGSVATIQAVSANNRTSIVKLTSTLCLATYNTATIHRAVTLTISGTGITVNTPVDIGNGTNTTGGQTTVALTTTRACNAFWDNTGSSIQLQTIDITGTVPARAGSLNSINGNPQLSASSSIGICTLSSTRFAVSYTVNTTFLMSVCIVDVPTNTPTPRLPELIATASGTTGAMCNVTLDAGRVAILSEISSAANYVYEVAFDDATKAAQFFAKPVATSTTVSRRDMNSFSSSTIFLADNNASNFLQVRVLTKSAGV